MPDPTAGTPRTDPRYDRSQYELCFAHAVPRPCPLCEAKVDAAASLALLDAFEAEASGLDVNALTRALEAAHEALTKQDITAPNAAILAAVVAAEYRRIISGEAPEE